MRLAILFCLVLASGIPAYAADRSDCRQGRGRVTRKIHGFKIQISPYPDKSNPDLDECEAEIYDPRGDVIFSEHDWGFTIDLAGIDVNGDGIPDVVLEAFSGGVHCCWTYYFFSLGPQPGLFLKLENNRDASFFWDKKPGQMYMEIQDGAFDYFDEVCHACSPFPLVYLRLDGSNFVDIGREYADNYDEIIRVSQKALSREERRRLKALTEKPSDAEPVRKARYNALMIVFAYLYSGREELAHQALQELWPPFDQERIWNLILETRHNGILCYTRKDAVCGLDAANN
jgi:hypothetical protein